MKETIQIGQAGRVVLPKHLRDSFHLKEGDQLAVDVKGGAIELRPAKPTVRLQRVNGVLVLTDEAALPEGRDFVAESRDERIDELMHAAKERP